MTPTSTHRPTPARNASVVAAVVASAVVAFLAGCGQNVVSAVETTGAVPDDYRVNHAIAVEEGVVTLDVPVGLYTERLTEAMRANVVGLAQRFKVSASKLIAVVAPSGSLNQNNAALIAAEIEELLRQSGIPATAIDYRVYHAASDERNAPIRLAYSTIVADTAPCGPWRDQLSVNHDNRNYFAFGCASQQNLAAVVDNPLDLLYPRGLTPADAQRRANVLEKYRTGSIFSADLSRERGGSVAQGVGSQ